MAMIVIEMGHVPRTTGRTGTWREQELTRKIGTQLAPALTSLGHQTSLIGADNPCPKCDVFISLHGDSGNAKVAGSGQSTIRGASVGYPGMHSGLAKAWKIRHNGVGWPGGWFSDNWTINLSGYYRWGQTNVRDAGYKFLAEHGTLTHRGDEEWLFNNIHKCVEAHVLAIGDVVGHPIKPQPVRRESVILFQIVRGPARSAAIYMHVGAAKAKFRKPSELELFKELHRQTYGTEVKILEIDSDPRVVDLPEISWEQLQSIASPTAPPQIDIGALASEVAKRLRVTPA